MIAGCHLSHVLCFITVLSTFRIICCSFFIYICNFPKCTRTLRGVANTNDALSYLEKLHRWGAFDEGKALGFFVTIINSFTR